MRNITVIGIGDRYRGDDGVGPAAIELLRLMVRDDRVHLASVRRLGSELTELVSRSDLVLFITSQMDGMPGKITDRQIQPVKAGSLADHASLGPDELLGEAAYLYGGKPMGLVFSVGVQAMGFQQQLSPVVQRVLPVLVEELVELIRTVLHGAPIVRQRRPAPEADAPASRMRYHIGA